MLHADDAADALALRHQVEGLVDFRERHAVRDELLHLQLLRTIPTCSVQNLYVSEYDNFETGPGFNISQEDTRIYQALAVSYSCVYLLHVHLHDIGQVSTWLEVAKEGALQSPLVQEVHWVGLEFGVHVRHTHQNSYTPALHTDHRFNDSNQWGKEMAQIIMFKRMIFLCLKSLTS